MVEIRRDPRADGYMITLHIDRAAAVLEHHIHKHIVSSMAQKFVDENYTTVIDSLDMNAIQQAISTEIAAQLVSLLDTTKGQAEN